MLTRKSAMAGSFCTVRNTAPPLKHNAPFPFHADPCGTARATNLHRHRGPHFREIFVTNDSLRGEGTS